MPCGSAGTYARTPRSDTMPRCAAASCRTTVVPGSATRTAAIRDVAVEWYTTQRRRLGMEAPLASAPAGSRWCSVPEPTTWNVAGTSW
jgi:hypothetical protein